MEAIAKELDGESKSKAAEINKIVLADLKSIDKLVSCPRLPAVQEPSVLSVLTAARLCTRRLRLARRTTFWRRALHCVSMCSISWLWSLRASRTNLVWAICEDELGPKRSRREGHWFSQG